MFDIYKFNNKPFIDLNKFQSKKIIEFQNKLKNNHFKFIENPCVCGVREKSILLSSRDKFGLRVFNYLCTNCGIIRQDPILDNDSIVKFYSKYYREIYEGDIHTNNFEKIFNSQYHSGKKIYKTISKCLLKENLQINNYKKVLEIGCGPGGILKYFNDMGHDVLGLDYDNNYSSEIKKKNINFENRDFLEDNFNDKYDLIILSHVIEHFTDLDKIINKLKKLLNPNGVLYILTPGVLNFEKYGFLNLVNQFKRTLFLFYLQNAHIYYFSLNSLKNIFVKYSNDFSYIYGDEEIQIILIKKESQKIIPFQNDYQKIIKFYKKNYFR